MNVTIDADNIRRLALESWTDSAVSTVERLMEAIAASLERKRWISGIWTHIFVEQGRQVERECDILFDREAGRVVRMNVVRRNVAVPSTEAERDDVTDSLVNANPEAIDDPESHDLVQTDQSPWDEIQDGHDRQSIDRASFSRLLAAHGCKTPTSALAQCVDVGVGSVLSPEPEADAVALSKAWSDMADRLGPDARFERSVVLVAATAQAAARLRAAGLDAHTAFSARVALRSNPGMVVVCDFTSIPRDQLANAVSGDGSRVILLCTEASE